MQTKWVIYIVMLWLFVSLICGVAEGVMFAGDAAASDGDRGAIATLVDGTTGERWGAIVDMMGFNFAIFSGGWAFLRWVFFIPFTVAVAVASINTLRGISS